MRIAATGGKIEEAVVRSAVGGEGLGGEAMFFPGKDACKEEYPSLHSTSGLGERRGPVRLSIKRRTEMRFAQDG